MKTDHNKIGRARGALSLIQLNDAEQLLLAKRLLEDVFVRLEPMHQPAMCVAEGYLCAAVHAADQARMLVETHPHESLPATFEELDEMEDRQHRPAYRADVGGERFCQTCDDKGLSVHPRLPASCEELDASSAEARVNHSPD